MTHPSSPRPAPYRLRGFGTLALSGPNDNALPGARGHHRRRLALLAVLAAAGDEGRSRDQLLLFFWPETSQSRARHSLEQLLYTVRGALGESVFTGSNPVRLNPDVVSSDIGAFTTALERGDLETAAGLYRGPFLDGFYLDDASEFERWVEAERARLSGEYASALERLARHAESTQDHATAVRWWRKLAEADPLSSKSATGLIRALTNAGDHSAALQYSERYEAIVKEELGTNVGPAVADLVAEVRAGTKTASRSAAQSPPAASEVQSVIDSVPSTAGLMVLAERPARWRGPPFAVVTLVVAVIVIAASWLRLTTTDGALPPAENASIAVLPFTNVSGDPKDAVIVDGLTEDLITALSKIGSLRVIARQSSFGFRNSTIDARRIGDSLKVTNLLEGSIQRGGAQLRVQVRLVDARNGSMRWSESYNRVDKDFFAVQRDIATSVARALDLQLGQNAAQSLRRRLTENSAAHDLYLRGRDQVHLRSASDSGPRQGLALLQQAVALDPSFAAAYASMPRMYNGISARAADVRSAREYQRLALVAARKALALDSLLPEAHMGLGNALYFFADLPGAEAAYRRSIALGGSFRVYEALTRTLMWSGRYAEALSEALRAEEVDPLSATAIANVGEALCVNGRYEEGLAQLRRVPAGDPPLARLRGYRALCHALQGQWPAAVAELQDHDVVAAEPLTALLGYYVARSGDVARAREMESKTIERWRETGRGAIRVAFIAAGQRDLDKAFVWLERSADDLQGTAAVMYPLFEELHADPRFERYRQLIGRQKR